jgi:hypothetical protein
MIAPPLYDRYHSQMNDQQPYLEGVARAHQAAGLEKNAISRWLADKVGIGVGTAIDKTEAAIKKAPLEELADLPDELTAELPGDVSESADPTDGIIDTPEEAEEAVIRAVLEVAGVDPPEMPEITAEKVGFSLPRMPWQDKDTTWETRGRAGGAALGGALGLGAIAALHPSVRRSVGHWALTAPEDAGFLRRALSKKFKAPEVGTFDPEALRPHVQNLVSQLTEQGVDPATARIAVSGTGGTGKSTLARMLSEEMGMDHVEMDPLVRSLIPKNRMEKYFEHSPPKPGTIYEQIRVLAETDPDRFDAIVHLERPASEIYHSLMQRGRAAWQMAVKDYPQTQALLREAFEATEGAPININDTIRAKVKPRGGFGADEIINTRLKALSVKPGGRSRWSRIQKSVSPYSMALPGWLPEWRKTLPQEVGSTLGLGAATGALVGDLAGEAYDEYEDDKWWFL